MTTVLPSVAVVARSQAGRTGPEAARGVVLGAELLQLLLDKYTFENVKNSWLKVCFYYDYLGPAK